MDALHVKIVDITEMATWLIDALIFPNFELSQNMIHVKIEDIVMHSNLKRNCKLQKHWTQMKQA